MDKHSDALSKAERQRLREIEVALTRDDPDFAASLTGIDADADSADRRRTSTTWLAVLGVVGVLGVCVLTAGLVLDKPVLGVFGFAMVVAVAARLVAEERIVTAFRVLIGLITRDPDPPS